MSYKKFILIKKKKAVSPVIATILLVTIAVVGAGLNFTMAQQYFNSAQASSFSGIESVLFLGYDATDSDSLRYHDGILSNPVANWHGNQQPDGLRQGERIGIFVQNHSIKSVTFSEIRIAGNVYVFQNMGPSNIMTPYSSNLLERGEYTIVINGNQNAPADTISGSSPKLHPGQTATIVLEMDNNVQTARDMQVKLTTSEGGTWVYTVVAGQEIV